MIKRLATTILFSITVFLMGYGQKRDIDSSTIPEWKGVGMAQISNNGEYFAYQTNNTSINVPSNQSTYTIKAIHNSWKVELNNDQFMFNCIFTADSKKVVYIQRNGTLKILDLGKSNIDSILDVSSFKVSESLTNPTCVYRVKNLNEKIFVKELKSNRVHNFSGILDYYFSSSGNNLILVKRCLLNGVTNQQIDWVNLKNMEVKTIWRGDLATGFFFNDLENKLAFVSNDKNEKDKIVIFDYNTNKAFTSKPDNNEIKNKVSIDKIVKFSKDETQLVISCHDAHEIKKEVKNVMVDIWSYFDLKLQSRQKALDEDTYEYLSILEIKTGLISPLESDREQTIALGDRFLLCVRQIEGVDRSEAHWNPLALYSTILVDLETRNKTIIDSCSNFNYMLSPGSKFLLYFNYFDKNYYSYEIQTRKIRNITSTIRASWNPKDLDQPYGKFVTRQISGWLDRDSAVIISDQHDIWAIDPMGEKKPINLTNCIGKIQNITFELMSFDTETATIRNDRPMYLCAFNNTNKKNGFYKIAGIGATPSLLTMSNNVYYFPELSIGYKPLKAKFKQAFIVRCESATESPNYYYTTDFKNFQMLSDCHPEIKYKWLTTELHTWKTDYEYYLSGILYKPEGFNPTKKYPVILNYYDKKSQFLNKFLHPDFTVGEINIPWCVSRGYLVFCIDIKFKIGETGKSSLIAAESAANYLRSLPFVKIDKLGIQGSSFGGYSTNYIVTHSNIFAAAASSVGLSDLITMYGDVNRESGVGNQEYVEMSGLGMEVKLWDNIERYIENSPIFSVKNVTTPILLENNKGDVAVDFKQGLEFYNALRRMGKKVWLLQYDNEGHAVIGPAALDYTKRLDQFFDYYLKDAKAPRWMTRGVDFKNKGTLTGFEYDSIPPPPTIFERKTWGNNFKKVGVPKVTLAHF